MGISDKYGQVTTTNHGVNGPIGRDEPVALFRAQDNLAVEVLRYYKNRCAQEGSPADHIASIDRQIQNFQLWQGDHLESVRIPGTTPRG